MGTGCRASVALRLQPSLHQTPGTSPHMPSSAFATCHLSLASPRSEIEEAGGVVPPIPCQQSVSVD